MLRLPLVLLLLGVPLLTGGARGQTAAAQVPIVCDMEDLIEDAACRTKLKGMFTRNDDTLTINLDGGKSKKYVGNRGACNNTGDPNKCVIFRVARYFPKIQSYLIEKALYEGGDFLLVNRRSGSETTMSTVPGLSPTAKYLISIDRNEEGDREYDIAIWSADTDPPKLEFKYKGKQNEYWEIKSWKQDARISMKAWVAVEKSYDQEAELVRKDNGWTLMLGKKTDRKE
jgi:hypothetical protein